MTLLTCTGNTYTRTRIYAHTRLCVDRNSNNYFKADFHCCYRTRYVAYKMQVHFSSQYPHQVRINIYGKIASGEVKTDSMLHLANNTIREGVHQLFSNVSFQLARQFPALVNDCFDLFCFCCFTGESYSVYNFVKRMEMFNMISWSVSLYHFSDATSSHLTIYG